MALIESGLLTQLSSDLGYKLFHDGQVHTYADRTPASDPAHRGMLNPRTVSAATQQLAEQVYEQAAEGRMVLTLGGDHSIAIGTIAGSARAVRERLGREMAVIWVDAHADINTPETSGSGNIHGMPVAFLTGLATEEDDSMFGWVLHDWKNEQARSNGHANGVHMHHNGMAATAGAPLSLKKLVYIGLRDVDRGEKEILRKHGIKAFSMHDIDR
jgi:arginase